MNPSTIVEIAFLIATSIGSCAIWLSIMKKNFHKHLKCIFTIILITVIFISMTELGKLIVFEYISDIDNNNLYNVFHSIHVTSSILSSFNFILLMTDRFFSIIHLKIYEDINISWLIIILNCILFPIIFYIRYNSIITFFLMVIEGGCLLFTILSISISVISLNMVRRKLRKNFLSNCKYSLKKSIHFAENRKIIHKMIPLTIVNVFYCHTNIILYYFYLNTTNVPESILLLRKIILCFRCFTYPLFLFLITLKEPLVYYLNCFKHKKKYKTKPQEAQLRNFGEVYFIQLKNQWGDLRQRVDMEKE